MNQRALTTVLLWDRMTRWRYHVEKAAHSAFIGLVLFALVAPLVWAMVGGAAVYLVVGKLTVGRAHHPSWWLEVLDWVSDLIIGLAGAAVVTYSVYGVGPGVGAVAVWCALYATISYRWAVP